MQSTQSDIDTNQDINGFPVDILVVEDNDSQRASIVEALKVSIHGVSIVAVSNGTEALDFLLAREVWSQREGTAPPRLILLDVAMPGSNGISLLAQIRSLDPEEGLTLTPVVVFTDSTDPRDLARSYRCGANSYIIKPLSYPDFQAVVKSVGTYWIRLNQIPV
jgi:two-component system response regulator